MILDKLSFRIEPGETLVLLGRSGSGKTTALKMVNGLLFPSSGEVLVDGRPTTAWDVIASAAQHRLRDSRGGAVPAFHRRGKRRPGSAPGGMAAGADRRADQRTAGAGGPGSGTICRIAARANCRAASGRGWAWRARWRPNPRLLLFDEPFGALDPVTRRELQDQFLDLRNTLQKTSIFVTHDVGEALRLGTRIALLDRGRLEILATPEEFLKSQAPETRAFLDVPGFWAADERR